MIRQELVFGERISLKPTPPLGSNRYSDLVAQALDSHILLELELLLPVTVASCSD